MSDSKVRFGTFIREQKASVRKLRIARLLERCDQRVAPIYVKNQKALLIKLKQMVFDNSLSL